MFSKTNVSIIGGGMTGVITALLLSRVKNSRGICPYAITIHERGASVMSGASNLLARLHMGGEYPLDPVTAENCVTGAFLFSQVFPPVVYAENRGIDYLVSKATERSGALSFTQLLNAYQKNAALYRRYYDAAADKGYECSLGKAGEMFRVIEDEPQDIFAGGIRTFEQGINSYRLNTFLTGLLAETSQIRLLTNQSILNASKKGNGYLLTDANQKQFYADIVLNAAWEGTLALDGQAGGGERPRRAFLRALGVADTSTCKDKGRAAFALLGADGGMYSPVDGTTALLYVPSGEISHVAQCDLHQLQPAVPAEWQLPLKDEKVRISKMKAHMVRLFPNLKDMRITSLNTRVALSFDDVLEKRRNVLPDTIAENWYSVVSTKATFSVWVALETLRLICPESLEVLTWIVTLSFLQISAYLVKSPLCSIHPKNMEN